MEKIEEFRVVRCRRSSEGSFDDSTLRNNTKQKWPRDKLESFRRAQERKMRAEKLRVRGLFTLVIRKCSNERVKVTISIHKPFIFHVLFSTIVNQTSEFSLRISFFFRWPVEWSESGDKRNKSSLGWFFFIQFSSCQLKGFFANRFTISFNIGRDQLRQ